MMLAEKLNWGGNGTVPPNASPKQVIVQICTIADPKILDLHNSHKFCTIEPIFADTKGGWRVWKFTLFAH